MDSKPFAEQPAEPARQRPPAPVKIVIAGGFGVGKTTTVGAISEIQPLRTEALMTSAGAEIDRTGHVPSKTTTTVALDFGCITIDEDVKLYLFGTPGQDRFGFMWHDIVHGALGALVIVDTRRMDDCYPAVDYFEKAGLPFVVGVNLFDGVLATTSTTSAGRWPSTTRCRWSPSTPGTSCRSVTRCSPCCTTRSAGCAASRRHRHLADLVRVRRDHRV